jgi:hypothetical protein
MGVTWVLSFSLGKFQWGWVKHNPVRLSNFIDPHISEKTLALARAKFDHWWCPGSWFGYGMLWPYDVVSGSNSSQPSRPSDVVRWFMPRIQPALFAAASSWALDQGSVRYLSNRRPAFILNQPSRTARHSTANPSLFQNMEYRQIQSFLMFFFSYFFCNQNGQFEIIISFPLLDIAWQKNGTCMPNQAWHPWSTDPCKRVTACEVLAGPCGSWCWPSSTAQCLRAGNAWDDLHAGRYSKKGHGTSWDQYAACCIMGRIWNTPRTQHSYWQVARGKVKSCKILQSKNAIIALQTWVMIPDI